VHGPMSGSQGQEEGSAALLPWPKPCLGVPRSVGRAVFPPRSPFPFCPPLLEDLPGFAGCAEQEAAGAAIAA